ncbi:MAG TPA: hypothetical protein VFC44_13795 [Candidatus Saccharimonadales bacterium]|nr:hypothetical protein [Candidatus Saccharimonadales bacterium]
MKSAKFILLAVLFFCGPGLRADQIEMQNGDHYSGKVISMTADTVVLESDVLGKINVPRAKVGTLHLSPSAPVIAPKTPATATPDIAAALRQLGANTNFIEQIRRQFLQGAGPEANAKYDEMIGGLMSGKLDMNTLRKEAKSAADQLRSLKSQGDNMGGLLDTYLSILDSFLKESSVSTSVPVTHTNYGVGIVR